MSVKVMDGTIFDSDAPVLACPVNTVGAMGAGLAKEFRDRHPDVYYHYKRACRSKILRRTSLQLIKADGAAYKVLMVPTKDHWKDDSDPQLVRNNIRRLRRFLEDRQYVKLAVPMLGCGLGKLDAEKVLTWMHKEFDDLPNVVEVWRG